MITILGLGFVGLTTGLGFAKKGFKTFGIDINKERLEKLKILQIPFHEPHLKEVLTETYNKTFFLDVSLEEAVKQSEVMPISIARPFNNYGPGMNLGDKRLPADFAKAIVEGKDIEIFSDGSPTRTFCYISDAITGYLKVMLYGKLEAFNIGIDKPEISVKDFSAFFTAHGKEIFDYKGKIEFAQSEDKEYMTDNPNRRRPDISKAKNLLNYNPKFLVNEGIGRFLTFLKLNNGRL